MSFRINHNISAINAHRILSRNDFEMGKSLERLSSGLKINKAGDDPAGLVISENMRAQITGLNQAIENGELATTMVQTAEGALTEVHALLNSMRELAIHASNNGAMDAEMLAADQAEIENALATLQDISENTQYGVKKLLNGTAGTNGSVLAGDAEFMSGGAHTESGHYTVNVTASPEKAVIPTANSAPVAGITADETLTIINNTTGLSVTVPLEAGDNAQTIADKINEYSDTVGMVASTDGTDITATSKEYGSASDFTIYSDFPATDGSQSGFLDDGTNTDIGVDVAGTFTFDTIEYQVLGVGAVLQGRNASPAEGMKIWYTGAVGADVATVYVSNNSLTFQIGANAGQTVSVALQDMSGRMLGRGLDAAFSGDNAFANLSEIDVLTTEAAQDALAVIDKAINDVSGVRGDLGAFQSNTLENTLNNLKVAQENLVAAESVIRDTDMASEVSSFTRGQILVQTATAMLAQANSTPNIVLSLLK